MGDAPFNGDADPTEQDPNDDPTEFTQPAPEFGRKHGAMVTAERLTRDAELYYEQLTPREVDALERTRTALLAIAGGQR